MRATGSLIKDGLVTLWCRQRLRQADLNQAHHHSVGAARKGIARNFETGADAHQGHH